MDKQVGSRFDSTDAMRRPATAPRDWPTQENSSRIKGLKIWPSRRLVAKRRRRFRGRQVLRCRAGNLKDTPDPKIDRAYGIRGYSRARRRWAFGKVTRQKTKTLVSVAHMAGELIGKARQMEFADLSRRRGSRPFLDTDDSIIGFPFIALFRCHRETSAPLARMTPSAFKHGARA